MMNKSLLQAAGHKVIAEAMQIFCRADQTSAGRRHAVMNVYIIHYGGISLYVSATLDRPNEKALIDELAGDDRADMRDLGVAVNEVL